MQRQRGRQTGDSQAREVFCGWLFETRFDQFLVLNSVGWKTHNPKEMVSKEKRREEKDIYSNPCQTSNHGWKNLVQLDGYRNNKSGEYSWICVWDTWVDTMCHLCSVFFTLGCTNGGVCNTIVWVLGHCYVDLMAWPWCSIMKWLLHKVHVDVKTDRLNATKRRWVCLDNLYTLCCSELFNHRHPQYRSLRRLLSNQRLQTLAQKCQDRLLAGTFGINNHHVLVGATHIGLGWTGYWIIDHRRGQSARPPYFPSKLGPTVPSCYAHEPNQTQCSHPRDNRRGCAFSCLVLDYTLHWSSSTPLQMTRAPTPSPLSL